MTVALTAAVNNSSVLAANLMSSQDVPNYPLYPMLGFSSAGMAYNAAIDSTTEEIMIFLHQDIYLPPGWMAHVLDEIKRLNSAEPDWAVLGVVGVDLRGRVVGRAYSTGLGAVVGSKVENPLRVQSLDEIVLVLRRSSGVRFDETLPGFHLYGTDLCQSAISGGFTCHVIEAFCVHNSQGFRKLPNEFWPAYRYLADKWRTRCPIVTPCTKITCGIIPFLSVRARDYYRYVRKSRPGARIEDPAALYDSILPHL